MQLAKVYKKAFSSIFDSGHEICLILIGKQRESVLHIQFYLFISNLTQFEPSKLLKISIVLHCST